MDVERSTTSEFNQSRGFEARSRLTTVPICYCYCYCNNDCYYYKYCYYYSRGVMEMDADEIKQFISNLDIQDDDAERGRSSLSMPPLTGNQANSKSASAV